MSNAIRVEESGERVLLVFQRPARHRAAALFHVVVMAAACLGLLGGAVYILLVGHGPRVWPMALFFVAMAGFAAWNGWGSLAEKDCLTTFDTSSRRITMHESGATDVYRGPVSFDDVVSLDTTVGYADSYRSVIVHLRLSNGESWRLGFDNIWVRPSTTSDVPGQMAGLRTRLGFAGRHIE